MTGFVRVPVYLVGAKEHTKERGQLIKLLASNLKTWTEWKEKQGWILNSTPKITGPFDPPTEGPSKKLIDDVYPEHKRYYMEARFTRNTPLWVPFEAAVYLRDEADRYGIDFRDSSDVKDTGKGSITRAHIEDDGTPFHDPMKYAEERRKNLGLKREDLLFDEDPK